MTSNQIAYNELKLDERKTAVQEAAQAENERHNKASEDLQSEANAINQFSAQVDADYKTTQNQLTREYNNIYEQIMKTKNLQEDQKIALQERLTEIDRLKAEATASYYEDMANIQATKNEIDARAQAETSRHNKEMETVQKRTNILSERKIELEGLQLDYNKRQFEESNELRRQEIDVTRTNTLYKGYDILQKQQELRFQMGMYKDTGASEAQSRTFSNIVRPFVPLLNPLANQSTGFIFDRLVP